MLTPKPWYGAALAAATAVLVWVILWLWVGIGRNPPDVPPAALIVLAVLVVTLLIVGLPVRRWNRGDRTRALNPLRGAQVAALAVSAVWVGSLISGWYAGQALAVLPMVEGVRAVRFALAAGAFLLSVALSVAGHVVKGWCTLSGEDLDDRKDHRP
jgi:hypothetical protein